CIDLAEINLRFQVIFDRHVNARRYWLVIIVYGIFGNTLSVVASLRGPCCCWEFTWSKLFSSFANIRLEPWTGFPSMHWLIFNGDSPRWAGFFTEQARFALQVKFCLEAFLGNQLNEATAARWQFRFLIGIEPGNLWAGKVAEC